jgi:glutathione S-transferase
MENDKTNLIIYGHPISQPTRSVLLFCALNKIKYDFVLIDLAKGEQYSDEYKKINPLSQVPTIKITHEGKEHIIRESCTILRFLSEYYKVDAKWYSPNCIFRRAQINTWLDWHHSNTRYVLGNYVFGLVFTPMFKANGINVEAADTKAKIPGVLSFLNKELEKRAYLADIEISIADLLISCEINQLELVHYELKEYPKLVEYLEKLNSLPEMKEINKSLYELKGQLSEKKQ